MELDDALTPYAVYERGDIEELEWAIQRSASCFAQFLIAPSTSFVACEKEAHDVGWCLGALFHHPKTVAVLDVPENAIDGKER